MNVLLYIVVFLASFELCLSYEATYKAGIVENFNVGGGADVDNLAKVIRKAGQTGVDILLLPSLSQRRAHQPTLCESSNYDEMMKSLSQAAKEAHIYIVAQLLDTVKCSNDYELFESSLLFDRNGGVTLMKPVGRGNTCNSTIEETVVLETDFGVQFTHIYASDILLKNPQTFMKRSKNLISSGSWNSELPFLASQFLSSWSSIVGVNLLTSSGMYSGKYASIVPVDSSTRLLIAAMHEQPRLGNTAVTAAQPAHLGLKHEDLSQYVIRPLNLDHSNLGHEETVCHGDFCCHFLVKTVGSKRGAVPSYSLAVFRGIRQFGSSHRIGVQSCAVIACSGLYKRKCIVGSSNETGVVFEALAIKGNFSSENAIQYPTSLTNTALPLSTKDFTFEISDGNQISLSLKRSSNLLTFGVFGREFSNDSTLKASTAIMNDNNIYDYVFTEEMGEFLDYVWIRLRVLIFVVTIYVLEMM